MSNKQFRIDNSDKVAYYISRNKEGMITALIVQFSAFGEVENVSKITKAKDWFESNKSKVPTSFLTDDRQASYCEGTKNIRVSKSRKNLLILAKSSEENRYHILDIDNISDEWVSNNKILADIEYAKFNILNARLSRSSSGIDIIGFVRNE